MKLKNEFAFKQVLDMNVAVSVGSKANKFNGIIRLNDTGKRILELIQDGKDEDEIVKSLLDEYDAPENVIRTEVDKVIDQLVNEGVLEK